MPNKIDLSGRFAVVTGGAQGIGRAIVERFLDSGAAVAIWDRDKPFAEKTAAELNNRGKAAAIYKLILTHETNDQRIEEAKRRLQELSTRR